MKLKILFQKIKEQFSIRSPSKMSIPPCEACNSYKGENKQCGYEMACGPTRWLFSEKFR